MATARDVVEAALREIGVLAASETASAQEATDGLVRLNRFIDRLAAEKLAIFQRSRIAFGITANDSSLNIGTGQDIAITRPVFIDSMAYIDVAVAPSETVEHPLHRLTDAEYAAIPQKGMTATYPQAWYYQTFFPTALITLWPVPTYASLGGVLYYHVAVSQLASLDTAVALPPGYEEMLVTNLAMFLCPSYGRTVNPALLKAATDSLATVKRANSRTADLSFEAAALIGNGAGSYDIRKG
jgi:hypothetical protein